MEQIGFFILCVYVKTLIFTDTLLADDVSIGFESVRLRRILFILAPALKHFRPKCWEMKGSNPRNAACVLSSVGLWGISEEDNTRYVSLTWHADLQVLWLSLIPACDVLLLYRTSVCGRSRSVQYSGDESVLIRLFDTYTTTLVPKELGCCVRHK